MERYHMPWPQSIIGTCQERGCTETNSCFSSRIPPGFSTDEADHLASWQEKNIPALQAEPPRVDLELGGIK